MTLLMVVGGLPSTAYNDVELIDLSGRGRKCRSPDDFPGSQLGLKES